MRHPWTLSRGYLRWGPWSAKANAMTGTGSLPVNLPGIQAGGTIKTPANMIPGGLKVGPHHSLLGAPTADSGAPSIGLPGKINVHGPSAGAPGLPLDGHVNLHGPVAGAPGVGIPGKLSVHGLGSAQFIHNLGIARVVPNPLLPGSSFLGGGMSPGRKP